MMSKNSPALRDGYRAFQYRIADDIDTHGQSLVAVLDADVPFCYTVGNARLGLPELLLIGAWHPALCEALNLLGQRMRDDAALPEGLVELEGWPKAFKVRRAGNRAKSDYTVQAGQFLQREDYDVLQVMLCDKQDRYPGDFGCESAFDVERV